MAQAGQMRMAYLKESDAVSPRGPVGSGSSSNQEWWVAR